MNNITLRPIETAPEPELLALQQEVFEDYEPSTLLTETQRLEAAARPKDMPPHNQSWFGVAAFRGSTLVGWTQGYREEKSLFYMLNSGVASTERRKGIYSKLVDAVLEHSKSQGYSVIRSRHAAANNAVIIAKLRLGFQVSGFEYSEVYGPLVQLKYFVSEARRNLYGSRARPIRPAPQ